MVLDTEAEALLRKAVGAAVPEAILRALADNDIDVECLALTPAEFLLDTVKPVLGVWHYLKVKLLLEVKLPSLLEALNNNSSDGAGAIL